VVRRYFSDANWFDGCRDSLSSVRAAAHPKPSFLLWAAGASSRWRSDHAEPGRGDRGGLQFAQGEFMSPKRSISAPIHARTNTIVHRCCICPPIPAFVVDCRENL